MTPGRRPIVQRALGVIAGGLLLVAGVVLLLPLPEAGLPLILLGLRLLAWQFRWARVANSWVDQKAKTLHHKFKSQPLLVRMAILVLGLAILVAAAWFGISHL